MDGGRWAVGAFFPVIPAQAGIQGLFLSPPLDQRAMDSRLRGNDEGKGSAGGAKRTPRQRFMEVKLAGIAALHSP